MDENTKQEMEEANKAMLSEFVELYSKMDSAQRTGIIALVALISKWRMQAGYKVFCRAIVQMLKDGELNLEGG